MAMRRSATTIQKTFRGYQVRKEYNTVRTGTIVISRGKGMFYLAQTIGGN